LLYELGKVLFHGFDKTLIETISNGDVIKLFSSSVAAANKSFIESAPNYWYKASHPEARMRGDRHAHRIVRQEASRSLAQLPNPSRVLLEEFFALKSIQVPQVVLRVFKFGKPSSVPIIKSDKGFSWLLKYKMI